MRNAIKTVLIPIMMASAWGCSDGTQAPKQPASKSANDTSSEGKFGASNFSLNKPQVDASGLKVLNISVAKVKNGEIWQGSLSIETSGDADYVQFKACHDETKDCVEGKTGVDRVLLKPFALGRVTITAKACAETSRVSNAVNCGEEYVGGEFVQPNNINKETSEFAALRANKIAQIEGYAKEMQEVLKTFNIEIEKCTANDEELKKLIGMRKTVQGLIALGEPLIAKAITSYLDKKESTVTVVSLAEKDAKPISKTDPSPAVEYAKKGVEFLKDVADFIDMESIFQAFGTTSKIAPVNAIQTLGNVVLDLFTAKENVKRTCFAEENAAREITRIKGQVTLLIEQIKDLEAKIAAGGI